MYSFLSEHEQKKKGIYRGTTLIIVAFSVAFYSRIVCTVTRLPSALNHLHFLVVPLVAIIILMTAKPKDKQQIEIVQILFVGLLILFGLMIASALINGAGVVNAIFLFMMLGGPFILLLSIIALPMSEKSFERFRKWIITASFANMVLAFVQWPLLVSGRITADGLDATDGMSGVFFPSGAGNYVSTTVSAYFSLYYLTFAKAAPLWLRIVTILGALWQLQLSDSKQVLFVLFCGGGLLILANIQNGGKALAYTILMIVLVAVFYWCIQNIDAFAAFKVYLDKDGIYEPDGEATRIKPIAFGIIVSHYSSPLNWLFGLGPGHTVGRLGGWLLEENWSILGPLGATLHAASEQVLQEYYNSWLALESTFYSPMFGWAGIWGDLGLLGLGTYLFIAYIIWRYLCFDNFSKFLLLSTAVFGFIFTQMEEPAYMLYTTSLIALRWQEHKIGEQRKIRRL